MRIRNIMTERDDRGHINEPVLSVYRDLGVVFKEGRTDNFNKTPENLEMYKFVEKGDVVVNKMKAWQGSVAVSDYRGIVSGDYLVCRVTSDVDRRFLHHLLRSRPMIGEYAARSKGIRPSQWRLYWEDFADIPISIPDLETQKSTSKYLDAESSRIDSLISKKVRMSALIEERRVSEIDSAILEAPGDLRSISDLATYMNGWPFKPDDFAIDGTPVIRIAQLTDEAADTDFYQGALPDKVRLRDGDLVFSWSGSLVVKRWFRGPAYLNQHLFRVLPKDGIDIGWLTFALDCATRLFAEHLHGSAMTHITQPMMKLVKVPLPTTEQQQEIRRKLETSVNRNMQKTVILTKQIELLQERRQALTTALVSGSFKTPEVAA